MPVAEPTMELWAYSIHGKKELQAAGLEDIMQCSEVSKSWFAHSVLALVCGRKPEVKLTVAPIP